MYLDFFGLKENPFNLVSDPRFLYYSESHCDAMSHLLYGVRERKGIILMLGEAGTGKTTLVRATLEMLKSTRVTTSVILNPILSKTEEFFEAMLRGFGLEGFRTSNVEMLDVLQRFLRQQHRRNLIPVLIVDEAQELSRPLLEQIRMLSNLEADGQKLLQFVLAAQPEMSDKLDTFELRALRQRIVVRCRLQALNAQESWQYIHSRLLFAGGDGRSIFEPEAVEVMYTFSGGIPRLLNSIADNCLLAAYARNAATVDAITVQQVVEHLELTEVHVETASAASVHQDVMRASSSWKEVVSDLKAGQVPEALKQFVENLQAPNHMKPEKALSAAVQRGE
ncbi:MAG: AAA family ATPase [Terriglobales bacterium]